MEEKQYCTNCGAQMDPNASVCVTCGVNKGKIKKYCAHCGKPVTPEQDVCTNCGEPLTSRLDFSKGKEAFKNLGDKALRETGNLAELASKKTGKKIKPSYLIGGLVAVVTVVIVTIMFMMPKNLNGTYTAKTTFLGIEVTGSYNFEGEKFTNKVGGEEVHGTYRIKDNELILKPTNGVSLKGRVSDDKKTVTVNGVEYKKDESN